jgi:alkanesulfonate monooxygenase SsuD/methylene tetrahydromethanopterin reductase-like flavin-dependent oxidoreductase (luciferase family)
VRDFEDAIQLMLDAWKGGDVSYRGRRVRVSPAPAQQPNLIIGGSVPAAARRAARFGLPYCPALPDPELVEIYLAEAKARGMAEPMAVTGSGPGMVLVTKDPDALWDRIGENLLYDARVYLSWQEETHRSSWRTEANSVDDLKASPNYAIVTPEQCVELVRTHGRAILHPLVAGIDPVIGWETLDLVANEVIPALRAG